MGLTKTEIFTDHQNRVAKLAKAIGHPARIAILEHLAKKDACVCGDLVHEIGLAQPTISQHLNELKNVGLILGTVEGTSVCYCLDPIMVKKIKGLFDSMLTKFEKACC